jgi:hypothetical protein
MFDSKRILQLIYIMREVLVFVEQPSKAHVQAKPKLNRFKTRIILCVADTSARRNYSEEKKLKRERNIKYFEDVDVKDFFDAQAAVEVSAVDRDKNSARALSLTPKGSSSTCQHQLRRMARALFALEAHQV